MTRPLKLLIVEDNPADAELVLHELRRAGFSPDWTRVDTPEACAASLHADLDIILSDFALPGFSGLAALEALHASGLDIPFILVSGTIGEETAVSAMKQGAADYLLKDRLARLGLAVEHALEKARLRREAMRSQTALRESEERFRQLAENIREVFWLTDLADNRILYVSPAYEAIWGRSCTELYASAQTWADSIHPDDRERILHAAATKQPEGAYDEEYRIVRPDGSIRWIRDRAFPVKNAAGGVHRVAGVARDVTARREAEDRVREQAAMLDLAHDAIIVRDIHSRRITFWNQGAERLYGWTAAEAVDRDFAELLDTEPGAPDPFGDQLLHAGEWHGECRHLTKTGKKLIISRHITLVLDSAGAPKSALSIDIDITEQKSLQAQFLRAQRMEGIGTLASGVAHDLNNILAPIMMSVPMLRDELSTAVRADVLSVIETAAQRGAEIVKQVLTFARGIEGRRVLVQPIHLIKEMVAIAQQTFPKSVTILASYPEDVSAVEGDPTQLHQVLLNLSVNARDAMPDGGNLILGVENFTVDQQYAGMMPGSKPGPHVLISVSDTGAGIPPGIIENIFDPFFTTKEPGKGTGLGLSTVIGIVKSHGGFVTVDSEIRRGTTFKIFLPGIDGGGMAGAGLKPPPPPLGRDEIILVVDDEVNICEITRAMLEKYGYRVVTATDGADALAQFARKMDQISAVLTDLAMPAMDGAAFARALRRMSPHTPVIASSGGHLDAAHESELRGLGVKAILRKPYTSDKLLTTLRCVLDGRPIEEI